MKIFDYSKENFVKKGDFNSIEEQIKASSYEALFSLHFLPNLAKYCYFHKLPYICYVSDTPMETLDNEWIYSPYNFFFVFASTYGDCLKRKGLSQVYDLEQTTELTPFVLETVAQNPVKDYATNSLPISICLIGKNEEKHVDACLKPWHDLGFEIIVADTGSTDRTMELSRKYTNCVFYHPWTNHFADARNSSASWARNPYIIVVDFDEYLTEIDTDKLKNALNPSGIGVYCIHNPNPNNMDEQVMLERVGRLYHKDRSHYQGRIHEQIHPLDGSPATYYQIPITLNHVGYSKPETTKEKATRNLNLLLLDLEEYGPDPYTYFQIGQSYRILKDIDKALEYYDLGLSMEVEPELDYVQTMVESYGYCLLEKGDIESALLLENIYDTFCVSSDFVFLMGLIYMNAGCFDEAIAQFEKATTIKKYATVGTNSFLAWYNAGVICEVRGQTQKAYHYYQNCGDYAPAIARRNHLASSTK